MIEEYIKNQLQKGITYDQISFKVYMDPFIEEKEEKKIIMELWKSKLLIKEKWRRKGVTILLRI